VNAHVFNQRVIENSAQDNFYKVLTEQFDDHFFSHLHDIALEPVSKAEVIEHFYDFFEHISHHYDGSSIARAYYFFYVNSG